jgi:hypothetical protein
MAINRFGRDLDFIGPRRRLLYRNGNPMRCDELYAAMGVPSNRLPDAGWPAMRVQGVVVRIEAKIAGKNQDGERTRACCPECQKWFGFARLRQHYVVHERAAW